MNSTDKWLCANCVGETFLKNLIDTTGSETACSYCGVRGKTFSVDEVAVRMDKAFEQHYDQTIIDEAGDLAGAEVTDVVTEAAGLNDNTAAEHIRAAMEARHFDRRRYKEGIEGPFEKDTYYARRAPSDIAYQEEWHRFEQSLKTQVRFFNRTALDTLHIIFYGLNTHRTDKGRRAIVVAGKDRKLKALYRARVFQSETQLKKALMRPDLEIGPPESKQAGAGRMNARGIAVFYGATKPETALAELRPPVGSDVVVGRFDLIQNVRLLDVSALADLNIQGSIFDPSYLDRLERAKFLSSLSRRITRPVLPDDEAFEYLVTQAIADYLATEFKLDGVIYRSAQRKKGINVALFHHAAQVEAYILPKGTELETDTEEQDEDGFHRSFTVYENVPKEIPPLKSADDEPSILERSCKPSSSPTPFLRLDLESIRVHEVSAVKYTSHEHTVSRHRFEKQETQYF